MTDDVIDSGGSQGGTPASVETSAPVSAPQKTEEMISASRMNEIVHERTRAALDKGYERGRAEASKAQHAPASSFGGMAQTSDEQYRAMARDEMSKLLEEKSSEYKRQQTQESINNLANNFLGKIDAAKDKYPDLVSRRDEIGEFAELIPFINEAEDVAGVTQHLLNNGHNVASLLVMAERTPGLLRRELKKLSDSIKQNDSARNWPHINQPLDQINPSMNAMDSGSSSIESLKNDPFLRG